MLYNVAVSFLSIPHARGQCKIMIRFAAAKEFTLRRSGTNGRVSIRLHSFFREGNVVKRIRI